MVFGKSIDDQARQSFGNLFRESQDAFGGHHNVLRENYDIYNEKIHNSKNINHNRNNTILTESITGYDNQRLSHQNYQKPTKQKNIHQSNMPFKSNQ